MESRKEMKEKGKITVKSHYALLLILCLVTILWGTEIGLSQGVFGNLTAVSGTVLSNSILDNQGIVDVYTDIVNDNLERGEKVSQEKLDEYAKTKDDGRILGRTNGVLAPMVNNFTSGKFMVKAAQTIYSVLNSKKAVSVIFILLGFIFTLFSWMFLKNIYKVVLRRMVLEARIYEKVPVQHVLFLIHVRKWGKAAVTMALLSTFEFLWDLTIIGGVIKYFSYYLVPYIVAENPDINPKEAICLSRKMMNGHKWECFKLELSFLGWAILAVFTLGISNVFWANPYKVATFAEYYANMRRISKKNEIEGVRSLNDKYLFKKAAEGVRHRAYEDIIEEKQYIKRHEPRLSKFNEFVTRNFGIWIGTRETKDKYQEIEDRKFLVGKYEDAESGIAYPTRLNHLWKEGSNSFALKIGFTRSYTIWTLIMIFFLISLIGWIYEVSIHLVSSGMFINRGTMFGPWLPIYGSGGVLILVLLNRFREKPVLEFLSTIFLCGVVEYVTSFVLEVINNGMHWWDYTGCFLNLNGRICAEGLIVFGVGGMVIVYLIGPLLDNIIGKFKKKVLMTVCIVFLLAFAIDSGYSTIHPNVGKGITDYTDSAAITVQDSLRQEAG